MNINEGARIVVEDWLHLTKDNLVYFVTDETNLKKQMPSQKHVIMWVLIVRLSS